MTKPFSMFEEGEPGSRWLIVGEAPGEEEVRANRPFVGASGKLLNQLLLHAGFDIRLDERGGRIRSPFHITNVFTQRPPDNDLHKHWTLNKTDLKKLGYSTSGRLPKLGKKYIHPDYEDEVGRLHEEIAQLNPEFILMLGGTALWALTGESRITVNRGTLLPLPARRMPSQEASETSSETLSTTALQDRQPELALTSPLSSNPKDSGSTPPTEASSTSSQASDPLSPSLNSPQSCPIQPPLSQSLLPSCLPTWAAGSPRWGLATFHPAAVIRQWDNRPLVWADLIKSRRFLQRSLPPPIRRRLWVDPTLEDLEAVYRAFSSRALQPSDPLGVDIETDPRIGQITSIAFGFADEAICIPFYRKNGLPEHANYWPTARQEAEAWRWVMRYGALPHRKVGQNFLYDHQYLLEDLDIRIRLVDDDTAILQHSLQPELPKALGVLASLYVNEPAWKFMRESTKDVNKADD